MTIDPNGSEALSAQYEQANAQSDAELPLNEILPVKTYVDNKVSFDPEWHGYKWKKSIGIYVGPIGERIYLYHINARGEQEALASFHNEEQAKQGLWWLDAMAQHFMQRDYPEGQDG